ncbi:sulfurtransferase [Curvibacter sp. RS43]|uniref:sulfurtransferase n=1 Tax=Curvibacter microcysteis TaxID=3026419 RepID=UPI00235EA084|nr:sulfurtransferase [Curvibacter sp. RS43]MDD0812580.1 sulfurtransferase [Curvibacter sp. RS43]
MTTPYTTLITASDLQELQAQGRPLMVFDCSFDLTQPAAGHVQFDTLHILGAQRADLDRDLSEHGDGAKASGGRHPLPSREAVAAWLRRLGFDNTQQAVVYDRNNSTYCVRLWWMLKWLGHDAVAVLDGGLAAWQAAGGATASGPAPTLPAGGFELRPALRELRTVDQVQQALGRPEQTLIDARATPRFKGEVEPLDPVAGHIPGALNRPFNDNLGPDGRFKPAAELRAAFEALLAGRDPAQVVHHCGSGVTALPNLLAMEVAGLGPTALFAGSWSEWCRDPQRPMARG